VKKLMLAAVAAFALVCAGLAVAEDHTGKSATAVTGSFTATTVSSSQSRSCKTTDGKTLQATTATYTGTATGGAGLTGTLTAHVRSSINTTDDIGTAVGTLRITASGVDTLVHFQAVYDHGQLAGIASGHAQQRHVALLANVSAGFTPTAGLTGGKVGGTSGGSAVELTAGACAPSAKGHGKQ
jgi:hypothetical protein